MYVKASIPLFGINVIPKSGFIAGIISLLIRIKMLHLHNMNTIITAVLFAILFSFNVSANEQCDDEEKKIITMIEKNLYQGGARRSSAIAYIRITVGSSAMIYAVVNSATGIGLLGFVVFIGGALDVYINSSNDEKIEQSIKRICV